MSNPTTTAAAHVAQIIEKVWDMPTVAAEYPATIEWLTERIEVHFDLASKVVIFEKNSGNVVQTSTNDVRVAVRDWIENEYGV